MTSLNATQDMLIQLKILISLRTLVEKMPPLELNFITGNRKKLDEVKTILGDSVVLTSQSLDLVEIQGTIEDISLDKCRRAAAIVCNKNASMTGLSKLR